MNTIDIIPQSDGTYILQGRSELGTVHSYPLNVKDKTLTLIYKDDNYAEYNLGKNILELGKVDDNSGNIYVLVRNSEYIEFTPEGQWLV